ncbi:hypothetical protein [Aquamicrobium defluvii]|uniref:Uncharacterized protein n=1 Tax=Aquamicrobium defluvii TaxID=69279 RepID=A0A4R6XZM2_9HYPH|nr:hypothetical protein [Aquamicrobium defluvii]TDR26464.1 hypothetical protein DES43_1911 [Aquamicrobium defluvii]
MTHDGKQPPDGTTYIFRASITKPDGTKIYARQFGKRAFKIPVSPGNDNEDKAA